MHNTKLRLWFVNDGLPRHDDFKHKLEFSSSSELRSAMESLEENKGLRAYLGNYELGCIWPCSDGGFAVDITEKFGNGILAVVASFYNYYVGIGDDQMDEALKNGAYLEEFLMTAIVKDQMTEVIITDKPYVSMALIKAGYMSVLSLKDAVHEDYKDKVDDEGVLFCKFGIFQYDNISMEENAETSYEPNEVWIVSESKKRSEDWKNKQKIKSSEQLFELMKEREKYEDSKFRLYFGDYEIGVLDMPVNKEEKYFALVGSSENIVADSIGTKLEYAFNRWIPVSFETLDSLINNEHTIESFISEIMGKEFDTVIVDDDQEIWNLINNGYRVLCPLNQILHYDVKNNPNRFYCGGYHEDERVILIKFSFHEWIYEELENEPKE